jgi:predicted membrane-bound mannosyltransferase
VRSLARAVVVWAPFVLFQLWQPWAVFHVVFPLVLAIGIGSALARPERGLPDRLVGTCLVPR